ncbi:MAG: ABC transporter substrate-binding protein [Methanomassiliicoccales archaeon]|jgi:iron complex transport system substrate-binding protein
MAASKKLMALTVIAVLLIAGLGAVIILSLKNDNGTTPADQSSTISVIDDRGVNVTVPKYPQHILSLGTAFTECLYAIGAQDQIIGVDSTSKYPTAVANKTNIGSAYTLNLENVTMLQPDLVIMWKSYTTSLTALTNLNMTVIAFDPQSVADVEKMINKLGNVTGKSREANSVVTDMQTRIAAVQQKVANVAVRPAVYMELLSSGGKSPGPGTMTDDVIGIAGGYNINANTSARYTKLTTEYVIGQDPKFIILETQNTKTNDQVKNTTGYGTISAVVNDKIMRVDGAWLTASPRIVLAAEAFASWFHPELFPA